MKGKIPIKAVERLSEQYACRVVIVFGLNEDGDGFCLTTYGATVAKCKWAAEIGKQIADAIHHGTISAGKLP